MLQRNCASDIHMHIHTYTYVYVCMHVHTYLPILQMLLMAAAAALKFASQRSIWLICGLSCPLTKCSCHQKQQQLSKISTTAVPLSLNTFTFMSLHMYVQLVECVCVYLLSVGDNLCLPISAVKFSQFRAQFSAFFRQVLAFHSLVVWSICLLPAIISFDIAVVFVVLMFTSYFRIWAFVCGVFQH